MDKDEARARLQDNGHRVASEARLPNGSGWQLRLSSGAIVNVYDNGRVNIQGKNKDVIAPLFEDAGTKPPVQPMPRRNVFVVYGQDPVAREQLEAMLRRWQLEPLILDQLPSEGQTLIEKLERVRGNAAFSVVLATPDDEGHRAGRPDEKAHRARQNVVLELGMMFAVLGRRRVAILLKDPGNMERPSDIQGLIYIPFKDHVSETAVQLAKEMNAYGIRIDLDRL
jgi:predicted nucleotide-binding protein